MALKRWQKCRQSTPILNVKRGKRSSAAPWISENPFLIHLMRAWVLWWMFSFGIASEWILDLFWFGFPHQLATCSFDSNQLVKGQKNRLSANLGLFCGTRLPLDTAIFVISSWRGFKCVDHAEFFNIALENGKTKGLLWTLLTTSHSCCASRYDL